MSTQLRRTWIAAPLERLERPPQPDEDRELPQRDERVALAEVDHEVVGAARLAVRERRPVRPDPAERDELRPPELDELAVLSPVRSRNSGTSRTIVRPRPPSTVSAGKP